MPRMPREEIAERAGGETAPTTADRVTAAARVEDARAPRCLSNVLMFSDG